MPSYRGIGARFPWGCFLFSGPASRPLTPPMATTVGLASRGPPGHPRAGVGESRPHWAPGPLLLVFCMPCEYMAPRQAWVVPLGCTVAFPVLWSSAKSASDPVNGQGPLAPGPSLLLRLAGSGPRCNSSAVGTYIHLLLVWLSVGFNTLPSPVLCRSLLNPGCLMVHGDRNRHQLLALPGAVVTNPTLAGQCCA